MIWLQSNDKYNEVAEYDPEKGTFTIMYRNTLGNNAPMSTDGFFTILSSVLLMLYKFDKELFIRVGDLCIPLSDDVVATVSGDARNRLLIVKRSGEEVVHLNYMLDHSKKIPNDPTPFIEDENFDFGLFLSNVSVSDMRKKVLLGLD